MKSIVCYFSCIVAAMKKMIYLFLLKIHFFNLIWTIKKCLSDIFVYNKTRILVKVNKGKDNASANAYYCTMQKILYYRQPYNVFLNISDLRHWYRIYGCLILAMDTTRKTLKMFFHTHQKLLIILSHWLLYVILICMFRLLRYYYHAFDWIICIWKENINWKLDYTVINIQ